VLLVERAGDVLYFCCRVVLQRREIHVTVVQLEAEKQSAKSATLFLTRSDASPAQRRLTASARTWGRSGCDMALGRPESSSVKLTLVIGKDALRARPWRCYKDGKVDG